MKYMLDTNICIHMMKHNPTVLSAFNAKKDDGVVISAITLAELEFGVCNNTTYYEKNRTKLLSLLTLVDVLPFDAAAAAEYGIIYADLTQRRSQIGKMDAEIAAHAKSLNLIVATNNTGEFSRVNGLIVEDWTI
jgi:tRNA(fMet)-specific endonuclease VapC